MCAFCVAFSGDKNQYYFEETTKASWEFCDRNRLDDTLSARWSLLDWTKTESEKEIEIEVSLSATFAGSAWQMGPTIQVD